MNTQMTPDGIEFLRTPDERFDVVEGFDYAPRYAEVEGLRMAYLDEGDARSGHTILMPHGEPTWSYLFRFMMPPLLEAGHRLIVPDLVGFGRSDKPVERAVYTYDAHVRWMRAFLDPLELENLTVFSQDWGGLITLRIAGEDTDRFSRIVAGNTALPCGESPGEGFDFWLKMSQETEVLDCGRLISNTARNRTLTEADVAAYNAPFPDESYMAGVRQFPTLVPIRPDDPASEANQEAWKVLGRWEKPFLTAFSDSDPITQGADRVFVRNVPVSYTHLRAHET